MLRVEAVDLSIPTSSAALLFRRRFRLPYPLFEMLMTDTRKWQCNASTHDVAGRQAIPLELKVLGVLRILGRGSCLNGITELSYISESAMQTW